MVVTVRVDVCAVPSVTGELMLQAGLVDPEGLTEQLSATDPVNPPKGVTVMTDVPELLMEALASRLRLVVPALKAKLCVPEDDPLTTALMPSVCTYLPVEASVATTRTL